MKKFNEFLNEAKDDGEYGQQGGMAKSQLRMIMSAAKRLHDSLKDDDVLPGHIIANIVLASDYVTGSADYMESEMDDEEYDDDEMDDMDEGLYHVSYGAGLDHQVVAKDTGDAHQKAMAHFKKTKPKLNDPKYADTFNKKSITRVKGDEPRSDKYKTEEVKLAEEQKPAYHYYATKNGIGAKEMKLTHSKSKPFTSETDALKHIGRQSGIIHKVNSVTGKVVQHRGIDGGQKGYPTPASDMAGDAPKHVRDLKEEVEIVESDSMNVQRLKSSYPYDKLLKSKKMTVTLDLRKGMDEDYQDRIYALKRLGLITFDREVGRHNSVTYHLKLSENTKINANEEVKAANLRITKVYNKFPKKATYAVHTSDRKYYKEFDNEAAAKAHHAEKSGK